MKEIDFKDEVRRHFDERAERYDNDTETWDKQDFANFNTVIPFDEALKLRKSALSE